LATVFIAGCGYTGRRVAERLVAAGHEVWATARDAAPLADLDGVRALRFDALEPEAPLRLREAVPPGAILLYSIPTIRVSGRYVEPAPELFQALRGRLSRAVYLSTTGVYGEARFVDENTPIAPATARTRLRVEAERAAAAGDWPALILRPAAIYGPGRGVQFALPRGEYKLLGDGSNFVSRIHVDDLAAIVAAGLLSTATGAYPVADEGPSRSREIAEFVARLLRLPLPESVAAEALSETRRADRRVDGRAIRHLLGIELRYPTFREGVPSAVQQ